MRNDVVCCGAKPLFFLDYIACGQNVPEKIAAIVRGVAEGCVQAGCALVGGETAEMPGFYPVDEYDLAGFCVGAVDKSRILDKETMQAGDVVLALPSSGVHSNGFSLVRKVFNIEGGGLDRAYAELSGATLGQTLLTPTRIYVQPMLKLLEAVSVRSLAGSTGATLATKWLSPSAIDNTLARCTPSTNTFTVPSGSLSICRMVATHPISNMSSVEGSSLAAAF